MYSINDIHDKYIIGFITQRCCQEQYLCELALLIGCTGESKGIVGSETVQGGKGGIVALWYNGGDGTGQVCYRQHMGHST